MENFVGNWHVFDGTWATTWSYVKWFLECSAISQDQYFPTKLSKMFVDCARDWTINPFPACFRHIRDVRNSFERPIQLLIIWNLVQHVECGDRASIPFTTKQTRKKSNLNSTQYNKIYRNGKQIEKSTSDYLRYFSPPQHRHPTTSLFYCGALLFCFEDPATAAVCVVNFNRSTAQPFVFANTLHHTQCTYVCILTDNILAN